MIDREFRKTFRLRRTEGYETIKTRFELTESCGLVEHVIMLTHPTPTAPPPPASKGWTFLRCH